MTAPAAMDMSCHARHSDVQVAPEHAFTCDHSDGLGPFLAELATKLLPAPSLSSPIVPQMVEGTSSSRIVVLAHSPPGLAGHHAQDRILRI